MIISSLQNIPYIVIAQESQFKIGVIVKLDNMQSWQWQCP
jgi:hypothetical protein